MDKKALEAAIYSAFEDVPYPGDDNIGDPAGRDDAEQVTKSLCGVDWRELGGQRLWDLALYYMVPSASHYYLPAYLLATLEDSYADAAINGINLCFHPRNISPERYPEATERFLTIVCLMSLTQKQVLRDVLIYTLKAQLNSLVEETEERELELREEPYERTEEEENVERLYWEKRLKNIYDVLNPMIEYWSHV